MNKNESILQKVENSKQNKSIIVFVSIEHCTCNVVTRCSWEIKFIISLKDVTDTASNTEQAFTSTIELACYIKQWLHAMQLS